MRVLSLFDGMSCGLTALKRAGIPVTKYYASEIDKYAIQVAMKNHPEIIQLGDVTQWKEWDIEKPDLIIGGSPCQGFSFAGKQLAFNDPRSALFFTMMDIIEHYKPRYKMLENVRMKKEYLEVITQYMGCEPMFINSALVSAQNRQRYYWFNWDAPVPEDRGIVLKDVLEHTTNEKLYKPSPRILKQHNQEKSRALLASMYKGIENNGQTSIKVIVSEKSKCVRSGGRLKPHDADTKKSYCLTARYITTVQKDSLACIQVGVAGDINGHDSIKRVYSQDGKSPTLTANSGGNQEKKIAVDEVYYRKLTPVECERLQTLPDNYTEGVSNTQRYRMLGNGWTVDVIAHIFKHIKKT